MIDVNKITSTLAKLPDAMLQKYAQLNKADPYIMALAMSESNRRKAVRSAGQGSMQAQPKVVDSEIAQMAAVDPMGNVTGYAGGGYLPEDQGIGRLNAGNMNFAGGGIIAFADGGDVERYQYGGTIYDPVTGVPISAENLSGNDLTMLESLGIFNPENRRALERADRAVAQKQTALPYNRATMPAPGYTRTDPRAAGADTFAESVKAVSAAPTADTTRKAPAAGLGAAAAATSAAAQKSTGPTDIEALQQKYFGPIDQEVGGLRNARAGLVEGIKDLADQNLAATKAGIEQRGDVYKGREERLVKQEKGLESMGDKYMGLALLQAGAAMMTTPGGIGAALGKGIDTGSKQYAMGMEKINAAKEKFAEARDRLDDLRINRDDMNAKDIRAAEKEARESKLKGQELLYNGLVSDLGIKQKNVTAIFGAAADDLKTTRQIEAERQNTITREGGANARNAATIAAQLNTPDRLVFDKLLKDNNNDAVKAAEALQKMKAEKFNMYEAYSKYLTGFAGKETSTPPMDFDQFASKFVPTTKNPGKGATILTQP